MIFEWDEAKREENLTRRQVDFIGAAMIFDDPNHIEATDTRLECSEVRKLTLGSIGDEAYVVAFTVRGEVRRISTAWKVGNDGRKRYQALLERRDQGDE